MRKISYFVIISLIVSLMASPISANADLGEISYDAINEFLQILAISESIPKELDKGVTRAEFLAAIVELFNMPLTGGQEIGFSDVSSSHPYAESIAMGVSRNIIYLAATFEPDRLITFNEAVKMSLCAVGYREKAELRGGYPLGYIISANETGLLKGVENETELSARNAKILLYNTLNLKLLEKNVFSGNQVSYVQSDRSLLNACFDIYAIKGQVTATDMTGLTSEQGALSLNKIEINGTSYQCYLSEKYIGYGVHAFYSSSDSVEEVVFITPSSSNKILELNSGQIDGFSNFVLHYKSGNKMAKATIAQNYSFILNGVAYNDYTNSDFKPDSGFVTLIDFNGDGSFDIVLVKSYETMVIKSIDFITKTIYDANGEAAIEIGANKDGVAYINTLTDEGYAVSNFDSLTVGMVINYALSKNGRYLEIFQVDSISGILTSISEDGIYIDDEFYETTKYFEDNLKYLNIGTASAFYLSLDGKVCNAATTAISNYHFGYLVRMIVSDNVSQNVKAAILTTKDVVTVFNLAPRVNFNDQVSNSLTGVYPFFVPVSDTMQQIILYHLNENGEISGLRTESSITDTPEPFSGKVNPEHIIKYFEGKKLYKSNVSCLIDSRAITPDPEPLKGGSVRLGGNTAIFTVPDPNVFPMVYDYERFSARKPTDFSDDETFAHLKIYNVDKSGLAGAMVNVGGSIDTPMNNDTILSIVERITTAVDLDGDARVRMYYWRNGTFISAFVDEKIRQELTNQGIVPGDVLRLTTDGEGTIVNFIRDFSFAQKKVDDVLMGYEERHVLKYRYGKVYSMDSNHMYMSFTAIDKNAGIYDMNFENLHVYPLANAQVVVFDTVAKTITPATITDIVDYLTAGNGASEVLIRQRNYSTNNIIIYK